MTGAAGGRNTRSSLLLLLLLLPVLAGCVTINVAPVADVGSTSGGGAHALWDPGNIMSDAVMFNPNTMTVDTVQQFLDTNGCQTGGCLGKARYTWPGSMVPWCTPIPAGGGSFAAMLVAVTKACGVNPQLALVMIIKESGGLSKDPVPAALTGFGCPDSGPGGSASCSASSAGVWNQTFGMVQAFAHLRVDSSKVNYLEGQSHDILWNVVESGCGSSPVVVKNRATAILYTYTPYQPNAASLAAFPGTGDACSSYGTRNTFRYFQKYFGDTGGGLVGAGVGVSADGVNVTVPDNEFVKGAAKGAVITAPTPGVAAGLAVGFKALGLPYVWGGSPADGSGPDQGCARGGGALNSCQGIIGFDCSGLTAYVTVAGGGAPPGTNSSAQRASQHGVPWESGQPGDIIGFPGHVAVYLGVIGGQQFILEASDVGIPVHVVPLTRADHDPQMFRYWAPATTGTGLPAPVNPQVGNPVAG